MTLIHYIRRSMEDKKYLWKLVSMIQNTGVMERRAGVLMASDAQKEQPAFQACYRTHREEFEKLAQMLEDDLSRRTLQAVIDYRLDPAPEILRGG